MPSLLVRAGAIAALLLAAGAAGAALPENLELRYSLHYGRLSVGHTIKTLAREPGGTYRHQSATRPAGVARMLTGAEWFEEGRFEVNGDSVRPLSFLKYREGGRKPRRHSALFDWGKQIIRFHDGREEPLPPGTQDEGSILFAFMLRPPPAQGEQNLYIASGKKLLPYRYRVLRTETLATALGSLRTVVIQRLPPPDRAGGENLILWLAPERGHIPVQMQLKDEEQREATLRIESVQGL
jgi:hypothetical protein